MSGCQPTECTCKCHVSQNECCDNCNNHPLIGGLTSTLKLLSKTIDEDHLYKCYLILESRIKKIEEQINKLEQNDRLLRSETNKTWNSFENTLNKFQEQHIRQIDENRKISRRVDQIADIIDELIKSSSIKSKKLNHLENTKSEIIDKISDMGDVISELVDKIAEIANYTYKEKQLKAPYKCPVCDGKGQWFEPPKNEYHCNSCNGTGIVWS